MSKHYLSFNIESYRGIESLEIQDLGTVNLIVGDNNVGKTSVLEAIQILSDPSQYNILQVARQRERYKYSKNMGLGALDLFLYLFNTDRKNNYKLKISGVFDSSRVSACIEGNIFEQLVDTELLGGKSSSNTAKAEGEIVEEQREIKTFIGEIEAIRPPKEQLALHDIDPSYGGPKFKIEINEYSKITKSAVSDTVVNVVLVQAIDHLLNNSFSAIIRNKNSKDRAVELLKYFDSNIMDLRYINDDGRFIPVVESVDRGYIPLSMYGDGMKKVLTILDALITAENGVLLVDEFETAVHTSAMEKVFGFMIDTAKKLNVQMFLTTHSIEALDKLLESAGEELEKVRVITLKRDRESKKILSRSLNGEEVLEDRKNFDFEVRQ